ncbi:MAG TPA: penicillin acylase family protein [Anaeromyxobacter sp.]
MNDGAPRNTGRSARARAVRWGLWAIAALSLLALVALSYGWYRLRSSLPQLDGAQPVARLEAPVTVERDALGVPTVRGASRLDVARATGFLHAQERFFQMDLLRRRAAGELAELFGPMALPVDRKTRRHRFRAVAARVVAGASAAEQELLEAYSDGVNAGLAALRDRPFEYLLLGATPAAWTPQDSVLVIHAMFIELNGEEDAYESALGALREAVPRQVFELLAPVGGEWDAPLDGAPLPTPPLPGADVLDLRTRPPAAPSRVATGGRRGAGSNNWAVSGARSAHGGAMLADDMHLPLSIPNIWYRAVLLWREGTSERLVAGVTLPGAPLVVAGSTGRIAWGFTNSDGDVQDLVEIEPAPGRPDAYLSPGGPRPFERLEELLRVKGAADERLEVLATIWGPVIDEDHRGRKRALAWTAHHAAAVNLALQRLEQAGTVEEALDVANASGIPPQNFVCADASGRIGWTIAGLLPRRRGFDGRLPTSWADGSRGWVGWRAAPEIPRIVDPPAGVLWTANSRTVDGAGLAVIGDGAYVLGARARQIRDDLGEGRGLSERDLLAIQLDDRALFLTRWQGLLLEVLSPAAVAADPRRREVRQHVERWGARAAVDSVGYRLVRAFRVAATERVLAPFLREARRVDPRFEGGQLAQVEDAVWRLLRERPAHLLDPSEESWDKLLLAAVDDALASLPGGGRHLAALRWGARNTAAIGHPLSSAVPALGWLLDMPADPLPGDDDMPRVQGPEFGASERMVVSPGREREGIFHMPGGQSGHPLSPHYRAGHEAWVRGEPTPFLPGPTQHVLRLVPGA